jgi:hypothetical protein
MKPAAAGTILTVRIPPALERSLERAARRRRTSKSELARELLAAGLAAETPRADFAAEARRQSLLVSRRRSERDALDLVQEVADTRGWE